MESEELQKNGLYLIWAIECNLYLLVVKFLTFNLLLLGYLKDQSLAHYFYFI